LRFGNKALGNPVIKELIYSLVANVTIISPIGGYDRKLTTLLLNACDLTCCYCVPQASGGHCRKLLTARVPKHEENERQQRRYDEQPDQAMSRQL
jgi:hypothetical protein